MTTTKYIHRVQLIVPAAQCKTVNDFIKANIDKSGGDWLTPSLSADGKEPFTHAQFSASLTDEQMTAMQKIVASVAKVSEDPNFDKLSAANKQKWFADQKASAKSQSVLPVAMDNTKTWTDPKLALTEMALAVATADAIAVDVGPVIDVKP